MQLMKNKSEVYNHIYAFSENETHDLGVAWSTVSSTGITLNIFLIYD